MKNIFQYIINPYITISYHLRVSSKKKLTHCKNSKDIIVEINIRGKFTLLKYFEMCAVKFLSWNFQVIIIVSKILGDFLGNMNKNIWNPTFKRGSICQSILTNFSKFQLPRKKKVNTWASEKKWRQTSISRKSRFLIFYVKNDENCLFRCWVFYS